MARSNNLYENTQGKIGNLIFYQLNGSGYVRTRPSHYKDRKSPAQLEQRQRLSVVTEFLRSFGSLLRITFASEAIGRSAMQEAQSYTCVMPSKAAILIFMWSRERYCLA